MSADTALDLYCDKIEQSDVAAFGITDYFSADSYFAFIERLRAKYLIRINPTPELDPEYLNLCLNTNYAREFYQRVKTDGVRQSNINAQKIGWFEVPFCSLKEQQEIVERAGKLLALADRIEQQYQTAKKQVDGLTQSILAKAFRGELVPTEAELAAREGRTYEPASQLLERIQSTKTASVTNPRSGHRRAITAIDELNETAK